MNRLSGKIQTPRSKIQKDTKIQTQTALGRGSVPDARWILGVWSFSGSWILVFGVSPAGSGVQRANLFSGERGVK